MTQMARAKTRSKLYSANTTFPADSSRRYFMLIATTGTTSVAFGGGDGKIPVTEFYEPYVCPIGEISIETDGEFIVHMG